MTRTASSPTRDAWMSRIAYHAVHDALERGGEIDFSALTEEVWARFAATTNLTRPKQDGSHAYAPADAGRKVADKLRLLRCGRLPPRTAEPVEEPPGADQVDVREARVRLDAALRAACDRIFAWHHGDVAEEAPQIGVRATVGLGKTASARRHLLALRRRLVESGAPSRIVICTPSHALAEETAAEWRADGATVAVLRGYEARHPVLRRPMCRDLEAVRAAIAVGEAVQTSVCADGRGRTCIHFAGCPKQENRREVEAADVVVAPYDALFTGFPISPEDIALILIAEGCWSRAAEERAALCVETFPHDLLVHDPARGKQDAGGKTADLHELRGRAAAAFVSNGVGPVSAGRLRAGELGTEDVGTAVGLERRRWRDPGLYPGMPQREREQALLRAAINARTMAYVAAWEAMGRLLAGGADLDRRLEIGPRAPETGAHPIRVRGVKAPHANLRGRPVLHLDATLRPELARTILPRLQVTEIEAAAPWMELRLVTGGFGQRTLCAGGHADEPELARRADRLADGVTYVRWLGLEAQRRAIESYAAARGATILARFTEVESGRCPDRPELAKSLHLAKVTGAALVIAKLDRLSRDAAFLLTSRDSGVRFAAVDLPEANDHTVRIMALVVQQEREATSRRTEEALSVARSCGVKLGTPNGAEALRRAGKGGAPLRAAIARNAERHAQDLAPVVADIRAGGATSLRATASELNERGMLTRRGGRWHVSTVMNLLDRLGLREADCGSPA